MFIILAYSLKLSLGKKQNKLNIIRHQLYYTEQLNIYSRFGLFQAISLYISPFAHSDLS